MKFIALLFCISSWFLASSAHSAEWKRDNLSIRQISFYSSDRPGEAGKKRVRVYFNEVGSWGSSDCRGDAGDVVAEDDHIYAAILTAYSTGKKFLVGIESDMRPAHSDTCLITTFQLK